MMYTTWRLYVKFFLLVWDSYVVLLSWTNISESEKANGKNYTICFEMP